MPIETISYLKQNAADLCVEEPLVITQNGKPKYVVEDYAQHQFKNEALAMIKLVTLSENEISNGDTVSIDDFNDVIKQKYQLNEG